MGKTQEKVGHKGSPLLSNIHYSVDSGLEPSVGHVSHLFPKINHECARLGNDLPPLPVDNDLKARVVEGLQQGQKSAVLVLSGGND